MALPPTSQKDPLYYLDTVTFEVENVIFKVPKYRFVQSSDIFRATFSLPLGTNTQPEGLSDLSPLKLEGISKVDFQNLLKVIYPLDIPIVMPTSREEWVSTLRLATMWNMQEVRTLAIEKMSSLPMDSVDKILFGRMYNVPQWLRSGYTEIVVRFEVVSIQEAERIGYSAALTLCHARETHLKDQPYRWYSVASNIENKFKEELEEVTAACAA